MLDIEKLIQGYHESVRIKKNGEYVYVTPPFFHIDGDESIALRFSEDSDGCTIIGDCGTTLDCLGLSYINPNDYREKLEAIKERFFIREEDGEFVMAVPTENLQMARKYLGYFIQAISLIANIDL